MRLLLGFILMIFTLSSYSQEQSLTREEEAVLSIEKGNAKAEAGDWKGALNEYHNAAGYDPKSHEAYYRRAVASHNLKDYRSAVNDYSKAIYLDNSDGYSYFGRGQCYIELGRKDNACVDLSKASGLGHPEAATLMMNNCN